MTYSEFIENKLHFGGHSGFDPEFVPECLFDFQKLLLQWACRQGRGAIFASCGLGKTPISLAWAQNVHQQTGKRVLILTPLAVANQFVTEGQKFKIECQHSRDGKLDGPIIVTNYERLHYFKPEEFAGVICDESSCLKNFDGVTKSAVTEFMRQHPYRLLTTATPAPNDFIELGTSSECLGEMGYMDMLGRFFKNDQNSSHPNRQWGNAKWRFRGHAERDFWRWVCSWGRAIQKPSDLGCDDAPFKLPPLIVNEHMIQARTKREGFLFDVAATNFFEEREERRRTIAERCEKAAEQINAHDGPSIAWCDLNDEGDLLEKLIEGAVQISGDDELDKKEENLAAFQKGEIKCLVTKPEIACFGLNLQNCHHQTYFPSHSYERWHQAIRRSWRFGQKHPVTIDVVLSEGQTRILANQQRKSEAAELMFARLVAVMNEALRIKKTVSTNGAISLPSFL